MSAPDPDRIIIERGEFDTADDLDLVPLFYSFGSWEELEDYVEMLLGGND